MKAIKQLFCVSRGWEYVSTSYAIMWSLREKELYFIHDIKSGNEIMDFYVNIVKILYGALSKAKQ